MFVNPLTLMKVGGFLKKNWLLIVVLAGVLSLGGYVMYLQHQVTGNRAAAVKALAENEQLKTDLNTAKADIAETQENVKRVDGVLGAQAAVGRSQARLKRELETTNVTLDDRPFADPGLDARAERMRTYQLQSEAK